MRMRELSMASSGLGSSSKSCGCIALMRYLFLASSAIREVDLDHDCCSTGGRSVVYRQSAQAGLVVNYAVCEMRALLASKSSRTRNCLANFRMADKPRTTVRLLTHSQDHSPSNRSVFPAVSKTSCPKGPSDDESLSQLARPAWVSLRFRRECSGESRPFRFS